LEFERDGEIISGETYVPEKNAPSISTTQVELEKIEVLLCTYQKYRN